MHRLLVLAALGLLCACTDDVAAGPGVKVTCTEGLSACGTECVDLSTNDVHCGACAQGCGEEEACAAGVCRPRSCDGVTCESGAVCIEGECVATLCVDVVCGTNERCDAGVCVCADEAESCGGTCVDTASDEAHCGRCGETCEAGAQCVSGRCLVADCPTSQCAPGEVCFAETCVEIGCLGVECASTERCELGLCVPCDDLGTDASCGACGRACESGTSCVGDRCLPTSCSDGACAPGEVCVEDDCVPNPCVGVTCDAGSTCSPTTGICTPCALGTELHCAACGDACASGESCAAGRCWPNRCGERTCGPGEVCVADTCVPEPCVGVTCEAGESCDPVSGDCESCGALDTEANCGACGRSCASSERCVQGECLPSTCGLVTCGPDAVCVADRCVPRPCVGVTCWAGEVCVNGTCECDAGWGRCGGDTCQPLVTEANCGVCGNSCSEAESCVEGECACSGSLERCGTACVDTSTDVAHCGGCGEACTAPGQACLGGECRCPEGTKECGGRCIDVLTDVLNCGSCGRTCGAPETCLGGSCVKPITCQSNFNDADVVDGCDLTPLDIGRCGALGTPIEEEWTGTLASREFTAKDFVVEPGDLVEITGTVWATGSNGAALEVRLFAGDGLVLDSRIESVESYGKPVYLKGWATVKSCSTPAKLRVESSVFGVGFALKIKRTPRAGANGAGGSIATAPAFGTLESGETCAQACGNLTGSTGCRDLPMWKVEIPAHGSVALAWSAESIWSSGAATQMHAVDHNGAPWCTLFNRAIYGRESGRNRIANNTGEPMTVWLKLFTNTGSLNDYDVAVMQEKAR